MARKILIGLLVTGLVLLAAAAGFIVYMETRPAAETPVTTTEAPAETTEIPTTEAPTTVPPTTVPPTTEPAPTETEPQEVRYTLTFTGDCTLASAPSHYNNSQGFIKTVGEDYGFPFRNVLEFFENDDFTIINLESVLADAGGAADKLFTFRGPVAYTQIMTSSSVEAVTLANNHTMDYGKEGYESTTKALTDAGIWFVEENKTQLVTTESGLVIGLYADSFTFSAADIQKNVKSLRDQGAEIIICAFHWGTEGSYRATGQQKQMAHAAIDAGADIVYGHHPHVLQPIEEYNDGYIFYSLGNFSFGGNHFPRDMDSAIVQVQVLRDADGAVSLEGMTIIPVSISSMQGQNNFQPTPYEEGTKEYDRALSKLDGTFNGPDLNVNYDHLKPTEAPTQAPTEAPAATEAPASTQAPAEPPAQEPPAEEPPAQEPPADVPNPT